MLCIVYFHLVIALPPSFPHPLRSTPPIAKPYHVCSHLPLTCFSPCTSFQVKAPKRLKMSNKEKKQLQKLREARKARGEEVTDSEEDA